MIKALLPAAFISALAVSAAWAMPPVLQPAGPERAGAADIVQVQHRRVGKHRYTAGRRYRRAPSGWHRHGARRPGDWRTRGCVIVGPIWFCP